MKQIKQNSAFGARLGRKQQMQIKGGNEQPPIYVCAASPDCFCDLQACNTWCRQLFGKSTSCVLFTTPQFGCHYHDLC